jgi:hypothetical protein
MGTNDLTISIADLSQILKKSVSTLRADMVRAPQSLPPWFKLPGSRRPLWLASTVEDFLITNARAANALPADARRKGASRHGDR